MVVLIDRHKNKVLLKQIHMFRPFLHAFVPCPRIVTTLGLTSPRRAREPSSAHQPIVEECTEYVRPIALRIGQQFRVQIFEIKFDDNIVKEFFFGQTLVVINADGDAAAASGRVDQ